MKQILSLVILSWLSLAMAWNPKAFEVYCGEPYHQAGKTEAAAIFAAASAEVFGTELIQLLDPDAEVKGIYPNSYMFYERFAGIFDPDVAANQDCVSASRKQMVASYAAEILQTLEGLGFSSPERKRLGPVFVNAAGQSFIKIYAVENFDGIASTLSPCTGSRFDDMRLSFMRFNAGQLNNSPPMQLYYILAHELVHVVQNNQPVRYLANTDNCNLPGWLGEGTADALAVYLTHKHFPNYYPPISLGIGKNIHGLRPYDKNLAWQNSQKLPDYRSSSFWTYLADRYHRGKYDFLANYFAVPDAKTGSDDWFAWLHTALLKDDSVKANSKAGLYLVFPDFLANYAGWGSKKYPHIDEKLWLNEAFGGCHTVSLSPQQSVRGLSLELEPLSGQCVRISVGGFNAGQLSAVKLMVQDSSEAALDNLHLAPVSMTSKMQGYGQSFNCYEMTQKFPQGSCLEKPFTGAKASQGQDGNNYVKTWLSLPQETATGSYENLFIVVHSPLNPSQQQHGNRVKQKVTLQIGLETSAFNNTVKPATQKTQGRVTNPAASNADELGATPMKGGEAGGNLATIMTNPDLMSQMMFLMPQMPVDMGAVMSGAGFSGLNQISLEEVSLEDELEPGLSFTISLLPPGLSFGARGSFKGVAMGMLDPQTGLEGIFFPWPLPKEGEMPENGVVEVLEYSEYLLHLKASGTVCQWGNIQRDASGSVVGCSKVDSFSGEIIKPFGWLYDLNQTFSSIDTPGMEAYRKDLLGSLVNLGLPLPSFPDVTEPDAETDIDTSSPAADGLGPYVCTCACDEFLEIERVATELEDLPEGTMPPQELMEKMQCIPSCMMQYAQCGE
ncbi:MAG: hypothetical protein KC422_13150 [Trueperaceae bacterium]|nr:hypothetical protein [Trueperaceae bacterium]